MNLRYILLCLCLLAGTNAFAYDILIEDIYYNVSGNEAEVAKINPYYSHNPGCSVHIPESIVYGSKTCSVTSIGSQAFANYELGSIYIPKSIKK